MLFKNVGVKYIIHKCISAVIFSVVREKNLKVTNLISDKSFKL